MIKKAKELLIKINKKWRMKRETKLRQKIVKKCPNLYRDIHERRGMKESLMCFGFETGPGWLPLIKKLSIKLEKMIKRLPEEEREHFRAIQVKEKYGTLRVYLSCETEEMSDAIDKAERESSEICEFCGKKGQIREHGYWLVALCKGCFKKHYLK